MIMTISSTLHVEIPTYLGLISYIQRGNGQIPLSTERILVLFFLSILTLNETCTKLVNETVLQLVM